MRRGIDLLQIQDGFLIFGMIGEMNKGGHGTYIVHVAWPSNILYSAELSACIRPSSGLNWQLFAVHDGVCAEKLVYFLYSWWRCNYCISLGFLVVRVQASYQCACQRQKLIVYDTSTALIVTSNLTVLLAAKIWHLYYSWSLSLKAHINSSKKVRKLRFDFSYIT